MSASPVLLVHGAWGGAWAWGFVQAELEMRGVTSVAIDLPSRNAAPSSMADDAAAVRAALGQLDEPAVVVGHSYAGVVITEASADNEKVKHLVYCCAILPQEGESTSSLMGTDPTPSKLRDSLRVTEDGLSTVDPVGAKTELFNDVSQEEADPIIAGLGTHRVSVFGEAATKLGWKEHPSTYIVTTQDRIFSPELQRRMATSATDVVSVAAGHVPLLSRPAELADAIAAAAKG